MEALETPQLASVLPLPQGDPLPRPRPDGGPRAVAVLGRSLQADGARLAHQREPAQVKAGGQGQQVAPFRLAVQMVTAM